MSRTNVDPASDACIVAVLVNQCIVGTGFLVADQTVVTCAHVIHLDDKSGAEIEALGLKLSIQFLVSKATPYPVSLDTAHFCRIREGDIAFLRLTKKPPKAASIAEMFYDTDSCVGREVRTKGYAPTKPFNCQPARGVIIGTSEGERETPHLTLEAANNFKKGHSGGPVFLNQTNQVIGMARFIAPDSISFRQAEVAYVIPSTRIREIYPELFPAVDHEDVHVAAMKRLSEEIETILQNDRRVCADLAKRFGFAAEASQTQERMTEITTKLLNQTVDDLVEMLMQMEKAYRNRFRDSVESLGQLYHVVMAAILDPKLVRLLRSQITQGLSLLAIPASSRTVIALVMAGVDGRLGRFRPVGPIKKPPIGTLEVYSPPERGIERRGKLDRESLFSALCDTLNVSLHDFQEGEREKMLQQLVQDSAKRFESLYLVDGLNGTKMSETTRKAILKQFPYLRLIDMQPVDGQRAERQRKAVSFLLLGTVLS